MKVIRAESSYRVNRLAHRHTDTQTRNKDSATQYNLLELKKTYRGLLKLVILFMNMPLVIIRDYQTRKIKTILDIYGVLLDCL